ncbi:hypothetical protein [Sphingomonas aerophila]|uniref:hypothetical protein n=1 Tax=Sphingomonas aerophila TaxID=1344948 RepID=UPI00160DC18A|nr:hypothetical protein [Sphingomonas aerophila]
MSTIAFEAYHDTEPTTSQRLDLLDQGSYLAVIVAGRDVVSGGSKRMRKALGQLIIATRPNIHGSAL